MRKPWRVSDSWRARKAFYPRWNRPTPSPFSLGWCANSTRTRWSSWGDILEVGVPFSDPIADGPTIQRAGQRALAAGTTLPDVLTLVRRLRGDSAAPIVLLTYLNPVVQYGVERFCGDARGAGVDGIVVPDLPADEADDLIPPARAPGLDTIFSVAPTTSDFRIRLAAERSRGFLYCVSLTGVPGP